MIQPFLYQPFFLEIKFLSNSFFQCFFIDKLCRPHIKESHADGFKAAGLVLLMRMSLLGIFDQILDKVDALLCQNALFQRNFQIAALLTGIRKLGVRIFDEFPDCIRQFAPLRTPGADGNKAFTTKQLFIIRVDRIDRLGGGDQDAAVLSQFTGIRAGMNLDGVFSKRCQTRR